jgi:hypothetical protein
MVSCYLGISPELLDGHDINVNADFPLKLAKKLVSGPRFEDSNVEEVHSNVT